MGTRSDVGIVIHKDIKKDFLNGLPSDWYDFGIFFINECDGHALYVIDKVGWDEFYSSVSKFLKHIRSFPRSKYKIVEACFDYPSFDGDEGSFDDNPFNLQKQIFVELCYDENYCGIFD